MHKNVLYLKIKSGYFFEKAHASLKKNRYATVHLETVRLRKGTNLKESSDHLKESSDQESRIDPTDPNLKSVPIVRA